MLESQTAPGVEARFRREADRWDEIYSDAGHPLTRLWDRWTRQNVRQRFVETFNEAGDLQGKGVLDIGCGSGRYLIESVRRGAGRVVGVDFAPEMLSVAERLAAREPEGTRIELRCADLNTLELPDRFDLVIANGLFDYIAEPEPGLRKAAGWTGGVLVASFPDGSAFRALPRALYWKLRNVNIQRFTPAKIEALARAAGLHSFQIKKLGPIFLLVARNS